MCVCSSFSVEPAIPIIKAAALLNHIKLNVILGEFNTYAQNILSPESPAYAMDTDCVILAIHTRDIAPDLWLGQGASPNKLECDLRL